MKILILGSTHGHEKIGLRVIEELRKINLDSNRVEFVVGNPKASELGVPFTEGDLNRVFPGIPNGNYEERRAFELSKKIKLADLVIDIHSTKTTDLSNNSMVIVTKYNNETKQVLELISPPKVLIMSYKSDNALISQAKIGIAFEYGLDESESVLNATVHDIATILMSYRLINQNPYPNPRVPSISSVYDVYDAFKKVLKRTIFYQNKLKTLNKLNVMN